MGKAHVDRAAELSAMLKAKIAAKLPPPRFAVPGRLPSAGKGV